MENEEIIKQISTLNKTTSEILNQINDKKTPKSITKKNVDKIVSDYFLISEIINHEYYLHGTFLIKNEGIHNQIDELKKRKKSLGVIYGEYDEYGFDNFDISLTTVSHIIDDTKIKKDKLYITLKILNIQYGKKIKRMMNELDYNSLNMHIRCKLENDKIIKIFTFDIAQKK